MSTRHTAFVIFIIGFSAISCTRATALGDTWTILPETQLPPISEPSPTAIRTAARFGFEKGTDGWLPRHPDVKIEQTVIEGKTGKGVLHVHGTEPSNWNFVYSPHMQVEPGKKYRAQMRARLESLPENSRPVYFKIEFDYDAKTNNGRVTSIRMPTNALQKWVQTEAEFQAPANCHRVWAAIEKGTTSPVGIDLSIDEFVLDEIGEFSGECALRTGALAGPITREFKNVHPRIYLTAPRLDKLRREIASDPQWAVVRKELFEIADRGVRSGPPTYAAKEKQGQGKHGSEEQLWQREVGNMIPHLAMAYLISGDKKYLSAAKQWIFASLSYRTWGLGDMDGMDLAAGHQLTGIGLGYDWLYNELNNDERALIREGVLKRAGAMARAIMTRRVWWHDSYMQNHQWVNCTGLATAGFATCDEIDEARGWIRIAHEKFLTTLATVGDDGASHEGYGYWEYGIEYIMRYMEMSRDLLGIDLYKCGYSDRPWVKNSPLYALYLSLPQKAWTRSQNIIDLADCPRYHWYGPSYLLRNIARRYPVSPYAGIAQWLAGRIESAGIDAVAGGHYLNLVWYDTGIKPVSPDKLPTLHHFKDIGIVVSRTGWSGQEGILVVKCGPPLGHKNISAPHDYGAGHVHPDAGHFTFFSGGQFLVRDDGYSYKKTTGDHNTILVDGKGQKGEGRTWFDYSPWQGDRRSPCILSVTSSNDADIITCDVAPAYPVDSSLKKFIRTFRFYKPDHLIIEDDLEAEKPVIFESRLHMEGNIERTSATNFNLIAGSNIIALISLEANAQAHADICKDSSGQLLCFTSKEKQQKTAFRVVIKVKIRPLQND